MQQIEICDPVPLLDDSGQPQNFGWSRQPLFTYNSDNVYAPRHRRTESDRYIVHSPTHVVVFEIRDDGWLGYMGISVVSLRDKKRSTQVFRTFAPFDINKMPSESETGVARWRNKKTHLDFVCMDSGARIIKADIPNFGHNRSMRCALVLSKPESNESLSANQPFRSDKNAFRYTRCCPWFTVEGVVQFFSSEIVFTKGNAWGILDWNRGARPKNDVRYWAAACGMSDISPDLPKHMSFCIGYSMADSSSGTENGFFIEGKLHKLDQVTFHIPLSNWLSPWRFTSNDNKLEMTFNPHQERIDRWNLLFYSSTRRQVFGFFSGKVQLDDGSVIEFHNLTGFAERSKMQF